MTSVPDEIDQGTDAPIDGAPAERRRQRAVESLGILDAAHQERLDRVTRMGQVMFGVPACSITMIDRDHAWYPSIQGLPNREVPREDTYCNRAVRIGGIVVSEDTAADPRFSDLPFVTSEPPLRFYAARTLRDPFGNRVGTFCLFDFAPRSFSEREEQMLEELGAWAEAEVLASAEMSRAHEAQTSMLPAAPLDLDGWQVEGMCMPALAVGGDYFDYAADQGILNFGVADVMGKGTAAALIGAGVRVALRAAHQAVIGGADLGLVMTRLEQGTVPDLERAGSFVTLFEGVADLTSGHLRWVDAGLGLALVVRGDGTAEQLTGQDMPIGVMPGEGYSQHETSVAPGDRVVVVSDGVLDLLPDPDDWLEPVADMVRRNDTARGLLTEVATLAVDSTPLDDVTVLAVYRCAEAEPGS